MRKYTFYIDTSIISALFDKRTPERKTMTEEFWEKTKIFPRYISNMVVAELETASNELKDDLLEVIKDCKVLDITDEVEKLADEYIVKGVVSEKFKNDAIHIAVAVINNIQFLVSWNFRHIVKVKTRKMVNLVNEILGYSHLEIIAPPEL
ncbi:MAG: PIN domain-containing protein [Candidatus Helarchaeota archaeon]